MLTGVFQLAVILLAGVIYYLVDFWLIHRYDKYRQEEGTGRSWGYTILMIGVLVFLVIQPILLPCLSLHIYATWGLGIQILGIMSLIGGFWVHFWGRIHLRQFYVEDVVFQEGHTLVETGPYQYVRHPLFTSFFLIVIGLTLVNPALPTLLVLIYALWDFSLAARQEEELLRENLDGYEAYMQRTGRFLPPFLGGR